MSYVLFFREAAQQDLDEIGAKALNLAILFKKGFKVPPGFIISGRLFKSLFSKIPLQTLYKCSAEELGDKCQSIIKQIKNIKLPESVMDEIIEAYLSLSVDLDKPSAASLLETKEVFVAVRASHIGNKMPASQTILNVKGTKRLFQAIFDCYALNFTSESISFRKQNNADLKVALIVQKMVDAEKSGVALSVNPETGKKEIIIKACFGLGQGLTAVTPDVYIVDKRTLSVRDIKVADKKYEFVRDFETHKTTKHTLGSKSMKQVLYDNDIIELARILKKIVNLYGAEQEIEWAMHKGNLYILQAKEIMSGDEANRVELEVYDDEEKPEIIDLEDDLSALEEIEKIEKGFEVGEQAQAATVGEKTLEKETPEKEVNSVQLPQTFEPVEELDKETSEQEQLEPFQDSQSEADEAVEEDLIEQAQDETVEEIEITEEGPDREISDQEQEIQEAQQDSAEEDYHKWQDTIQSHKSSGSEDTIFSNIGFDHFQTNSNEKTNEEASEKADEETNEESTEVKEEIINESDKDTVQDVQPNDDEFVKLAKLNARKTLIYCHMAIKQNLKKRLRTYVNDVPVEFEQILDKLIQYEPVEEEQDLRKLNKAKEEFVKNMKYPDPDIIRIALEYMG